MTKILMPVDGSDHDAKTAAFLGEMFGSKGNVTVEVLHVAHRGFPTAPSAEVGFIPVVPSSSAIEQWEKGIREDAENIVETAKRTVESVGLIASTRIAWGGAPEVIEQVAEEDGVDMIAIGSRGAGQITGLFLGSVSDRVLHRAKMPVLVVR